MAMHGGNVTDRQFPRFSSCIAVFTDLVCEGGPSTPECARNAVPSGWNAARKYYSGPGSSNPDGLAHAYVVRTTVPSQYIVGFEDQFNGGDKGYEDIRALVTLNAGARLLCGSGPCGTCFFSLSRYYLSLRNRLQLPRCVACIDSPAVHNKC